MRVLARLQREGTGHVPTRSGKDAAKRVRRALKWSPAYKTAYVASHPRTWPNVVRRAMRGLGRVVISPRREWVAVVTRSAWERRQCFC